MDSKTETMNLKSVSGLQSGSVQYVRAGELEEKGITGVVAEGIYEGTIANNKYPKKMDYKIKLANGDLAIVNTAGNLTYRMNQALDKGLQIGDVVQISYLGKNVMKKGDYAGTSAHNFDVAIDSED